MGFPIVLERLSCTTSSGDLSHAPGEPVHPNRWHGFGGTGASGGQCGAGRSNPIQRHLGAGEPGHSRAAGGGAGSVHIGLGCASGSEGAGARRPAPG